MNTLVCLAVSLDRSNAISRADSIFDSRIASAAGEKFSPITMRQAQASRVGGVGKLGQRHQECTILTIKQLFRSSPVHPDAYEGNVRSSFIRNNFDWSRKTVSFL